MTPYPAFVYKPVSESRSNSMRTRGFFGLRLAYICTGSSIGSKDFKLEIKVRKIEKLEKILKSRSFRYQAFRLSISVFITILLYQFFSLTGVEHFFYDLRVNYKPTSKVSNSVATIAIDQETVREMRRSPNAKDHIEFLKLLSTQNPKAIVYLIHPKELVGAYEELQEFGELAASLNNFVVLSEKLNLKGEEGRLEMPPPFTGIKVAIGPKLADRNSLGGDGVTRRMLISYEGKMAFHPQFAGFTGDNMVRGLIQEAESNEAYIDYHPQGTYRGLSFSSVLNNNISANQLTDKIVFVGRDTLGSNKDYVQTPYSQDPMAMTVLELHANMMDTMILNSAPVVLGRWINMLATVLISWLIVYVVLAVKPSHGLLILLASILAYITASWTLFSVFGVWLGMAHTLIAVFVCYYFLIPYRLILENRKSWELYQKNKILSQVEELKSNFLSMMSHDIKTPLARIQGMIDLVKRESHDFTANQTQALDTISQSSRELTEFISSILDLGRVESQGINLHFSSRDINSLVQEVIEKYDFFAKERNIEIIGEFEPMFSAKVDVELVRQVFGNLLENAIKYSPEGSRVLVTTEEVNGEVIIQFADQGMGISESEQQNIFMKFYRSKEAKNSKVKGTGIGLYLARYFVDLHRGRIDVESRPSQGSTFSVVLPLEQ